jgi:hypothetical protein
MGDPLVAATAGGALVNGNFHRARILGREAGKRSSGDQNKGGAYGNALPTIPRGHTKLLFRRLLKTNPYFGFRD